MDAFYVVLFGLVMYLGLIAIPSMMEKHAAQH